MWLVDFSGFVKVGRHGEVAHVSRAVLSHLPLRTSAAATDCTCLNRTISSWNVDTAVGINAVVHGLLGKQDSWSFSCFGRHAC